MRGCGPTPFNLPPQGAPGVPGASGDYGYIRYGEMMGTASRTMAPFVESPFVVIAPRAVTNNLKPPFAGIEFLDGGNILRARKAGDSYILTVRLSVISSMIGGWLRMSVNVAGNISGLSGPVASRTVPLVGAAGDTTRIDEPLQVFPAGGYLANGAVISLYASVPVALSSDVLFVTPQVAAP